MDGGIDYLKQVIVDDKLGVANELEKQMQYLVDTYRCEWAEVVRDPEKRRWFRQFVNTDKTEPCIEMVHERGQSRPVDWPKIVPISEVGLPNAAPASRRFAAVPNDGEMSPPREWVNVGKAWDFPKDGGACVKHGGLQIAVFNFVSRGQWYATQNMCPHKKAPVLSRGIIGDQDDMPKVACPLHKKTFSLEDGRCLSGEEFAIETFPVKVEGDDVYLLLPPAELASASTGPASCVDQCTSQA
jgi:nitrite reductase (NADH) large subunit